MTQLQYNEAFNASTKNLMSLEDIINASNQDVINSNLQCPTPGCPVQLELIRGKTEHLRAFPRQVHIADCPYAPRATVKTYTGGKYQEVSLNNKQISKRLNSLAKEAFTYDKMAKKQDNRPKPKKAININNHRENGVALKYSSTAKLGQSDNGRHTPHIPHLKPNEIRRGDEGKAFQGYGIIVNFIKVNKGKSRIPNYKIKIEDPHNHSELILKIGAPYFQRSPLSDLDNGMINFIKDYATNHQLMLGFIATVTDSANKVAEIKRDFDVNVLSRIVKNRPKAYAFTEFYAIVNHTFDK